MPNVVPQWEPRYHELKKLLKAELAALYRKISGYLGGMYPPEQWSKDELLWAVINVEGAGPGCDQCRQPGASCGEGGITRVPMPCVCCGEETSIRSRCGGARTAQCHGPKPEPLPAPAPARRAAPTRTARTERPLTPAQARAAEQREKTAAAIAGMATGQKLSLLAALEGCFAPLRIVDGRMRRSQPYWRPTLPEITYTAQVVTGYSWTRPYVGSVTVLDRSGAWVAAASSAVVAHGALAHTGETDFEGKPGYYQIQVYPWTETQSPHPLGYIRGDTTWVPAPTVQLLTQLADQGRWPDVTVLDSYTGDGTRINEWTNHVNALRTYAINTFGRDSEQYESVKVAFGMAMSLMLGQLDDHGVRVWKCQAARPDWTHTIQAQASATLWRWADECRQTVVVPELAPVGLRNVDELLVPSDAVEILASRPRPNGLAPMVLDPFGVKLGSFKRKVVETW